MTMNNLQLNIWMWKGAICFFIQYQLERFRIQLELALRLNYSLKLIPVTLVQ